MRPIYALMAAALVMGCAKGPELEPAGQTAGDEVTKSDAGVTVMVDPDRWWGLDIKDTDIVQLHVEIENDSGRPLLLRHDSFTLRAADGRTWTASDPSQLDLGLKDSLLEEGVVEEILEDVDIEDMSSEGYVYFTGLKNYRGRVDFHMDLVDASSGERFGHIMVPFLVDPDGDGLVMND